MKKCILIFFLLYGGASFAQNEYAHWVVDSYKINFCDSVSLSANHIIVEQNEGFATMCDKNTGQILFFTDAQDVWNDIFQIMPNGDSLNGGVEPIQASLIVPQPGSTTIFYLFTTDRYDINGLNYSIVDMSKDGGLGDVTVKNVFLDSASQRLNAVYDATNSSFWIITDNPATDSFESFKLDANGLNTVPVLSPTQVTLSTIFQTGSYLKSSPDGKHIVVTYEIPPITGLYNFDKNSGLLSLQTFLPNGNNDGYVFGVSFSPDNSKLYSSAGGINGGNNNSEIYQYDITSNDADTIKASRITIDSIYAASRFVGMQMGPDGKIYIVREILDSLSVINKPNLSRAACQFAFDTLLIPIQNYIDALSNNIDGLYYFSDSNNINLSYSVACTKIASFTINTLRAYSYFQVNFGDGSDTLLNSTQFTFAHQYNAAGTYTVKLNTASGCNIQDSVTISVTVDSAKCPVPPPPLSIPTLINGSGSQTQWSIINLPYNTAVTIYDELGRTLYKTGNYANNYDMRNLSPAMYFYRLDLQNGEELTGKILVIK